MKCPLHRKCCEPKAFKKYEDQGWFCAGIKERKMNEGVKMDVMRICGKGYYLKGEHIIDCTPHEAMMFSAILAGATADWLEGWDDYQAFIDENDK